MRELSLGNAPPVSEIDRWLEWAQRSFDEIERSSREDRNPDALKAGLGLLDDLSNLTDPNADRILFFDDSEGAAGFLTVGTGLAIATTTLSLSHLGIQSLTDPGADRILFWDDSATATAWLALSGLTITDTTLAVDAATTSAAGKIEHATDAEVRAATTGNFAVTVAVIESASALVTLTETAGAVAVDWDTFINGTVTVDQATVISNPTNGQPGTWRTILIAGNDATDRTITFDTQFGSGKPTITDCDSTKKYLLTIFCVTTSLFLVSAINGSA